MGDPEQHEPSFSFSGGRLCLDFANTLDDRASASPSERLGDYVHLVAWGQAAGVLTPEQGSRLVEEAGRRPAEATAALARAIALRESIFRIMVAVGRGETPIPTDLALLNAELSAALSRVRIVPVEAGFVWGWSDEPALDRVLWAVVRSAADLLTSDELGLVRLCGAHDCAWLFLDTTRNRSRRWCDMASCGNRAKARRHHERQRERRATQDASPNRDRQGAGRGAQMFMDGHPGPLPDGRGSDMDS